MLSYILLLLYGLTFFAKCQYLVYPAPVHFDDTELKDTERIPLYAPSKCPENHLLYPGYQKSDWICDCAPGFVYYPQKDGCFAVYRQGPCPSGQYLILRRGEFLPQCVKNPCIADGVVRYKGICHRLNTPGGPCKPKHINGSTSILSLIKSTLELRCVTGADPLVLIRAPSTQCPPGSRRSNSNDCRVGISDDGK